MNFLKKIYYKKYTKISYSISNVDLVINRIFSKKKKRNIYRCRLQSSYKIQQHIFII